MSIARKFKRQAERAQPQAAPAQDGEGTPTEAPVAPKPKPDMASFTGINNRTTSAPPVGRKATRRGTMRGK